jgi:hypothetical protein
MEVPRSSALPCARWPLLIFSGLLAGLSPMASAQAPASSYRSVGDVRTRIPDEHDRPYFRQTKSHRGYEIREPQFTIVAQTTADDAEWAARQVAVGWQQAAALADHWTQVHQQPDFGLNALQVVITDEPLREGDAPATTVNVVGIQTQVEIHGGPSGAPLAQQVARLREGAAFAMLHTTGLDAVMPPWVTAGMAAAAGQEGLSPQEVSASAAASSTIRFGGQQWRYRRATPDTLDYPRLDHEEAAARIAFMLKGDDAEHAPALLAAVRLATERGANSSAQAAGFGQPPEQPASVAADVDQLLDGLRTQYAAWKENPNASQPLFEPTADASPDMLAAQREMIVLLKLQRRFAEAGQVTTRPEAWATVLGGDARPVSTKIVRFDTQQRAATVEQLKPPTAAASFAALAERLSNSSKAPWATLDIDGRLLLSTDSPRVQSLFRNAKAYLIEADGGKAILARRLDSGELLRGWLENGPPEKPRLRAKFAVSKPSGR